jgi:hypothetical protein
MFLDAAYSSLSARLASDFRGDNPLSPPEIERLQTSIYPKSIFSISEGMSELGNECFHYVANCSQVFSPGSAGLGVLADLLARFWLIISRIPLLRTLYERSWMARKLTELIEAYDPEILYVLDPNLLTPKLNKTLVKQGRLVVGQIASPLPSISYFSSYDLMISADPLQVKYFSQNGIVSEYLPSFAPKGALGFDQAPLPLAERPILISFVGSFGRHHSEGTRSVQALAKAFPEFKIFTDAPIWKLRLLGLRGNFAGRAWGEELDRIYGESRVVFNRHTNISRSNAVNTRMFEATAAGAVLLTERAQNLSELFLEENEVMCYSDTAEVLQIVHKVISRPSDFQKIANAGRAKTLANHSAERRLEQLNTLLKSSWARKSRDAESSR